MSLPFDRNIKSCIFVPRHTKRILRGRENFNVLPHKDALFLGSKWTGFVTQQGRIKVAVDGPTLSETNVIRRYLLSGKWCRARGMCYEEDAPAMAASEGCKGPQTTSRGVKGKEMLSSGTFRRSTARRHLDFSTLRVISNLWLRDYEIISLCCVLSHKVCGDLLKQCWGSEKDTAESSASPCRALWTTGNWKAGVLPREPRSLGVSLPPGPMGQGDFPLKFPYLPTDRICQNETQLLSVFLLRFH